MKNTKKLLAFRLRLQGYSYKTIAEATGYSEFTLRRYLAPKGKWYKEYNEWANVELNQIQEDMHTMILGQAIDAFRVIQSLMDSSKPSIAFRAAQDVLDRAGFQKNNHGFTKRVTESTDTAEEMVKALELLVTNKNEDEYANDNYSGSR